MILIDKTGERQACDRCHRVRVKIRRGDTVCDACRRIVNALAWCLKNRARFRKYARAV